MSGAAKITKLKSTAAAKIVANIQEHALRYYQKLSNEGENLLYCICDRKAIMCVSISCMRRKKLNFVYDQQNKAM